MTELTTPQVPTWQRHAVVSGILQDHRRVRNVRACSAPGCTWKPTRPGYASDPEATARRHRQFNEHLAHLIVDAVLP